ncbi:MAG: hypothetical protein AB1393_02940 [Candidatus Edwardsbacteria bacterium]
MIFSKIIFALAGISLILGLIGHFFVIGKGHILNTTPSAYLRFTDTLLLAGILVTLLFKGVKKGE